MVFIYMLFLTKCSERLPIESLEFLPDSNEFMLVIELGERQTLTEPFPELLYYGRSNRFYYPVRHLSGLEESGKTGLWVFYPLSSSAEDQRFLPGCTFQRQGEQTTWTLRPALNKNNVPQYLPRFVLTQEKTSELFRLFEMISPEIQNQKAALEERYERLVMSKRPKIEPIIVPPPPELFQSNLEKASEKLRNATQLQEALLPFLAHVSKGADSAQFCTIVLTLLKRGISAEALLDSGIPGNFWFMNLNSTSEVKQAYNALAKFTALPELSLLLQQVKQSSIVLDEDNHEDAQKLIEHIALDASNREENQSTQAAIVPHQINLPLIITPSEENIAKLQALFSTHFFSIVLKAHNWAELKPLIEHFLKQRSFNEQCILLKEVFSTLSFVEERKRLFSIISIETREKLAKEPDWQYEVICYAPSETPLFTSKETQALLTSATVTKQNIHTLAELAIDPRFTSNRDFLCTIIAKFLFDLSSVDRNALWNEALKRKIMNHALFDWVKAKEPTCLKVLEQRFQSGEFTRIYPGLEGDFFEYLSKVIFLASLTPMDFESGYPQSKTDFQAWVISECLSKNMPLAPVLSTIFEVFDSQYSNESQRLIARLNAIVLCDKNTQVQYLNSLSFNQENWDTWLNVFLSNKESAFTAILIDVFQRFIEQDVSFVIPIVQSINTQDNNRNTTWHSLNGEQIVKLVELLIKNNAPMDSILLGLNTQNKEGKNSWHSLDDKQTVKLVRLLVENKADIDSILQGLNAKDLEGNTLWHSWYGGERIKLVEFLIKNEASMDSILQGLNTQNKEGKTTWHSLNDEQRVKLVELLIKNEASIDSILQALNTQNRYENTAWHSLNGEQIVKLVELLVENKASIDIIFQGLNAKDLDGNTLWHSLDNTQTVKLVELLIKNEASIDAILLGFNTQNLGGKNVWHSLSGKSILIIVNVLSQANRKMKLELWDGRAAISTERLQDIVKEQYDNTRSHGVCYFFGQSGSTFVSELKQLLQQNQKTAKMVSGKEIAALISEYYFSGFPLKDTSTGTRTLIIELINTVLKNSEMVITPNTRFTKNNNLRELHP